jgi:hypothetical protein
LNIVGFFYFGWPFVFVLKQTKFQPPAPGTPMGPPDTPPKGTPGTGPPGAPFGVFVRSFIKFQGIFLIIEYFGFCTNFFAFLIFFVFKLTTPVAGDPTPGNPPKGLPMGLTGTP